jgi:endonuclease-3
MLDLGLDGLKDHIKTIGLFNTKAQCDGHGQILVDRFGGEVPPTGMLWSPCPAWGARRPMWC